MVPPAEWPTVAVETDMPREWRQLRVGRPYPYQHLTTVTNSTGLRVFLSYNSSGRRIAPQDSGTAQEHGMDDGDCRNR